MINMKLTKGDTPTSQARQGKQPHYGVCNKEWDGLNIVDYALLAELAYFDPPDVPQALKQFFPPDKGRILLLTK